MLIKKITEYKRGKGDRRPRQQKCDYSLNIIILFEDRFQPVLCFVVAIFIVGTNTKSQIFCYVLYWLRKTWSPIQNGTLSLEKTIICFSSNHMSVYRSCHHFSRQISCVNKQLNSLMASRGLTSKSEFPVYFLLQALLLLLLLLNRQC